VWTYNSCKLETKIRDEWRLSGRHDWESRELRYRIVRWSGRSSEQTDNRTIRLFTQPCRCPSSHCLSTSVCRHVSYSLCLSVSPSLSTVVAARSNQARHSFSNFRCDVTWLCTVWSRLQIPRVRTVDVAENALLIVGFIHEFGFLRRDAIYAHRNICGGSSVNAPFCLYRRIRVLQRLDRHNE